MAKFKNKISGKIVEENLLYYVNKFRNDPNYIEVKDIKEKTKTEKSVKVEKEEEIKEEVENTPQ